MKILKTILCCAAALVGLHGSAQTETLRVWMDNVTVTADGSTITKLTVYENDVVDYTAFSLTMVVPNGVKVAQVKSGREYVNDISLTDRAASTHSINCNMDTETTIKIISTSTQNDNFYPDDVDGNLMDEIFQIGLVADPSVANGVYDIEIVACKFVINDANASASQPQEAVKAELTIEGGTDSETVSCVIGEDCCSTLILPFEAQVPDGVEVYTCGNVDGNVISPERQSSIPANVPQLVLGTPGTYVFTGIPTQTNTTYVDGNYVGVYSNRSLTSGYVLQTVDNVTGFYAVDSDTGATVPTYNCYMQAIEGVTGIAIDFTLTSLDEVLRDNAKAANYYDVAGRKVNSLNEKGVYVRRGGKLLVK